MIVASRASALGATPQGAAAPLPGRGVNGIWRALALLALGSALLTSGLVAGVWASVTLDTRAPLPESGALPWVPNAPLARLTRGSRPCLAPEQPSYGMIDPCPAVDWGRELEIRRAGGIRAGQRQRSAP